MKDNHIAHAHCLAEAERSLLCVTPCVVNHSLPFTIEMDVLLKNIHRSMTRAANGSPHRVLAVVKFQMKGLSL